MLLLIISALFASVLGQGLDSQTKSEINSCLMPCRLIAIKCVIEGADANKILELMRCVDKWAQPEFYEMIANRNPKGCNQCITKLKDKGITFEERVDQIMPTVPCVNEKNEADCTKFTNCNWTGTSCRISDNVHHSQLKYYKKQPCSKKDDKPAQCIARPDCTYDSQNERCLESEEETDPPVAIIDFEGNTRKFAQYCKAQDFQSEDDCAKCGGRFRKGKCAVSKRTPKCNRIKGSMQICVSIGCTWVNKKGKCKGTSNLAKPE